MPTNIYPTEYDFLYVAIISGDFDLTSGRNLANERNRAAPLWQYITPTENKGFTQLKAYDRKHNSHKASDEDISEYGLRDAHGKKLTIFCFKFSGYSELPKYNSWRTNVSKNKHRSSLFWGYRLETHI